MEGKNHIPSFPPKRITINQCQNCNRYQIGHIPTPSWVPMIYDSPDFIQYCLSLIQCPQNIRITRANILQTNNSSSHSFSLSIDFENSENQKRQAIVHFIVENTVCDFCRESLLSAQVQQWSSTVIISSYADRSRPLQYLEKKIEQSFQHINSQNNDNTKISINLLNACATANIMTKEDGKLIFRFNSKAMAFQLVSFIKREMAIKIEEIINKVPKESSFNAEFDLNVTYSISLPGIWIDDLACLPESICRIKGCNCLCICSKVSDSIVFTDPETGILTEISPEMYWDDPFPAFLLRSSMVLFDVISLSLFGPKCGRYQMCDAVIALDCNNLTESSSIINTQEDNNKIKHIIKNNQNKLNLDSIFVKSHLGNQLKIGGCCLGYDLRNGINLPPDAGALQFQPDAIIVSKIDSKDLYNHEYFVNEFMKDGFNIGMIKQHLLVNKVPPSDLNDQEKEIELNDQFNNLSV